MLVGMNHIVYWNLIAHGDTEAQPAVRCSVCAFQHTTPHHTVQLRSKIIRAQQPTSCYFSLHLSHRSIYPYHTFQPLPTPSITPYLPIYAHTVYG